MKKVLLPTDFSDNSYKAISYAMSLFKDEECTFFLLHTYTPAIYQAEYLMHAPMQVGLGDFYRSNSMQQLEKLQDRITSEFKNRKHKLVIHTAFNLLVGFESLPLLRLFSDGTCDIAEGEVLQLQHQHNPAATESDYLNIIDGKTSRLFYDGDPRRGYFARARTALASLS